MKALARIGLQFGKQRVTDIKKWLAESQEEEWGGRDLRCD